MLLLISVSVSTAMADDARWKVVKPRIVEDTFTEVQWTQRDNLGDINFNDAKAYCAGLSLEGAGWRLPTMNELSQLYSGAQGNKVPCAGEAQCLAPKGFYLTGAWFWSSEQGNSASEAWSFALGGGTRLAHAVSSAGNRRALCVRQRS